MKTLQAMAWLGCIRAMMLISSSAVQAQTEDASALLFIGELDKLEIIPRNRPGCEEDAPSPESIVLSNHCACMQAHLSVTQAYIPANLQRYEWRGTLGEWCEIDVPLHDDDRLLVFQIDDEPVRWLEVETDASGEAVLSTDRLDAFWPSSSARDLEALMGCRDAHVGDEPCERPEFVALQRFVHWLMARL